MWQFAYNSKAQLLWCSDRKCRELEDKHQVYYCRKIQGTRVGKRQILSVSDWQTVCERDNNKISKTKRCSCNCRDFTCYMLWMDDVLQFTKGLLKMVDKTMVHMQVSNNNRIRCKDPGEPVPISVVDSNASECILDHLESNTTQPDKHILDLKNLDSHWSYGSHSTCSKWWFFFYLIA